MTALDDACQGCAVCHSGFAVADKQCTACTGGQAPEACAAYADAGTSCECATCPDGWQLAQGACTECAADPTCTAFKANSCDCDTCASGHYLTVDNKCGKVGFGINVLRVSWCPLLLVRQVDRQASAGLGGLNSGVQRKQAHVTKIDRCGILCARSRLVRAPAPPMQPPSSTSHSLYPFALCTAVSRPPALRDRRSQRVRRLRCLRGRQLSG